ncbi:hypothetical protein [Methanobacterium formicicum]|uniref:Uncharacterized protein n=1 Tax=Methanobacterium formicicum TaxID=2162 RepID=A0A843AHA1_METFO|nr:hypothetical protein [Methanobacterium formicicum]MBF4474527.1 hypothetical protein [Methanobacterium formicicum]
MGRKYYGILALLAMIGLIVAVSGCTSNNSTDVPTAADQTSDQIKANATTVAGEALQRNADTYKNQNIKITGTVQAKDVTNMVITMANPNYIVKIEMVGTVPNNVLVGDTVTVYGVCEGYGISAEDKNPIPIVSAWQEGVIVT